MRTDQLKKSFFIRSLLVVMSLLYLLTPLYSELNILLHKISHQFVIENHHAEATTEKEQHHHKDHHDHDFLASNHEEESEGHHKKKKIEVHTHELISFFNSVFNNDTSNKNTEKHIFENKLDKHILTYKLDIPQPVLVYNNKNSWAYNSIAESLELEVSIPPPRSNPA